ncbi:hypothetical protein [Paracoccus shandongensis]|uniref:hypothetical protein n=1 Tax=Paracoccus shandongensis TaxID=2816048 RepID=UPI001A8EA22D|nr:hypothetical protein [Paracoccus shandongensis]
MIQIYTKELFDDFDRIACVQMSCLFLYAKLWVGEAEDGFMADANTVLLKPNLASNLFCRPTGLERILEHCLQIRICDQLMVNCKAASTPDRLSRLGGEPNCDRGTGIFPLRQLAIFDSLRNSGASSINSSIEFGKNICII